MTYTSIWKKGQVEIDSREFESFEDAKYAAINHLPSYRDNFDATTAEVQDKTGQRMFLYGGGGDRYKIERG